MKQSETALSPPELRTLAYGFLKAAESEADPQIKRGLAGCAFAMSQLAECIEVKRGEGHE